MDTTNTSNTPSITPTVTPITEPSGNNNTYTGSGTSQIINSSTASRAEASSALAEHAANMNQVGGYNLVPGSNNNATDPNNVNNPSYSDATTQMLDRISATSDAATKSLISTIQAQRQSSANALSTQYDNYKSGLQALGVQTNQAQATPQLLQGSIVQAENDHQAKLTDINIKMNKALMDANTAATNEDYKTLTEKNAYIKDLKSQQNETLKSLADALTTQKTISTDAAGIIYDKLQALDPAQKEAFLQGVSKQYNINPDALVAAVSAEGVTRARAAKSLATSNTPKDTNAIKFTTTQKDSLVNAGISSSNIGVIETAINQYGLDAVIASPKLTAAQKTAIQTVFAPKKTSGSFGG